MREDRRLEGCLSTGKSCSVVVSVSCVTCVRSCARDFRSLPCAFESPPWLRVHSSHGRGSQLHPSHSLSATGCSCRKETHQKQGTCTEKGTCIGLRDTCVMQAEIVLARHGLENTTKYRDHSCASEESRCGSVDLSAGRTLRVRKSQVLDEMAQNILLQSVSVIASE